MKIIANGIQGFISPIINVEGKLKEWQEWSVSFINILDNESIVAYLDGKVDMSIFYEVIDTLYKIEMDMRRPLQMLDGEKIEWI